MGPETDQAMLRYQIEYAEAFAFVFSLYSPKTLETAQTLYAKVQGAARNQHNIITMSDYDKSSGGMSVPVFLIGNRDADLAPPQGEFALLLSLAMLDRHLFSYLLSAITSAKW